jgi:hypothetical protein
MKTLDEIMSYEESTIDGRDLSRLARFMTEEQMAKFELAPQDGTVWVSEPFTREAVLEQLRSDLEFAFEKALNRRGISAGCMFYVIKMWMWVLDEHEDLINWDDDNYAQYGLPYLKAVALRYNLPNEIGDDVGDEERYASE